MTEPIDLPPLPPKVEATGVAAESAKAAREKFRYSMGVLGLTDEDMRRFTAAQMQEYARAAVLAERARCAAVADDESELREKAGKTHPEESDARGRCFAAARAAANVAKGIRSGEMTEKYLAAIHK